MESGKEGPDGCEEIIRIVGRIAQSFARERPYDPAASEIFDLPVRRLKRAAEEAFPESHADYAKERCADIYMNGAISDIVALARGVRREIAPTFCSASWHGHRLPLGIAAFQGRVLAIALQLRAGGAGLNRAGTESQFNPADSRTISYIMLHLTRDISSIVNGPAQHEFRMTSWALLCRQDCKQDLERLFSLLDADLGREWARIRDIVTANGNIRFMRGGNADSNAGR